MGRERRRISWPGHRLLLMDRGLSGLLRRDGCKMGTFVSFVDFSMSNDQCADSEYLQLSGTSSGVSAGIDVALAFVTATYSEAVAVKVANMLEYVRTTNSTFDHFAGLYGLSSANNTNV